jgi:hypothetical protein
MGSEILAALRPELAERSATSDIQPDMSSEQGGENGDAVALDIL